MALQKGTPQGVSSMLSTLTGSRSYQNHHTHFLPIHVPGVLGCAYPNNPRCLPNGSIFSEACSGLSPSSTGYWIYQWSILGLDKRGTRHRGSLHFLSIGDVRMATDWRVGRRSSSICRRIETEKTCNWIPAWRLPAKRVTVWAYIASWMLKKLVRKTNNMSNLPTTSSQRRSLGPYLLWLLMFWCCFTVLCKRLIVHWWVMNESRTQCLRTNHSDNKIGVFRVKILSRWEVCAYSSFISPSPRPEMEYIALTSRINYQSTCLAFASLKHAKITRIRGLRWY